MKELLALSFVFSMEKEEKDREAAKKWLVLYSKPRAEKKTAKVLEKYGFEVYCPLKKTRRKWSDRWKWVEQPLFTSYLFIRIEEERREEVFVVPSIVRYMFWLGKPAEVKDEEIAHLRRWLGEFDHEAIEVRLQSEDKVRVKSGPLIDNTGIVVETKGKVLRLLLDGLGAEVRVDLRKNQVEKLPQSKGSS